MKIKKLTTTLAMVAMLITVTPAGFARIAQLSPESPASFSVFSLPQNAGAPVNGADNESAAVLAPNGLSLYFSSNRSGTMGSIDIWVAQRPSVTSAWGEPQNLTMLNSSSVDNLPALSPDGRTIFFNCSCPGSEGSADIYMATRPDPTNDLGWTAPVNLGTTVNTAAAEIAAAYFEDPTNGTGTLFFTSDRNGGEDIFQSTRNANGTFNVPTAVASLNSPFSDRGVAVSRTGLEVFFSSDRDGGAGGRDIWVATRASLSAEWNQPVNLGSINTASTEQSPSLSPDGSILYFASTRDGTQDIYSAIRLNVNRSATADFDGDGRSDLSVFRPSDGTWYLIDSGTNTFRAQQFGTNGDRVVPGDYDGDGRTDIGVYRPSSGNWYTSRSSDGMVSTTKWGISTDRPVPGDYDGDGRTDIAVYRGGTWYAIQSSNGQPQNHQFGLATDIPIAGSAQ